MLGRCQGGRMTTFNELQRFARAPEPRHSQDDRATERGVGSSADAQVFKDPEQEVHGTRPGLASFVDVTDGALAAVDAGAFPSAPGPIADARPVVELASVESATAGTVLDLLLREVGWPGRHIAGLVGLDVAALLTAWAAFGMHSGASLASVAAVAAVSVPVWLLIVLACGGYDRRLLGVGRHEHRRLVDAMLRSAVLMVVAAVLVQPDAARELVLVLVPVHVCGVIALRGLARARLRRHRLAGRAVHRALVVGCPSEADAIARRLAVERGTGLCVVGTCPPEPPDLSAIADALLPAHRLAHVPAAIRAVRADTVLLTPTAAADPDAVRRLAWSLEGRHVDLLLAGVPADVAASRLEVQAVAGMSVVQLGEPGYPGGFALVRDVLDQIAAAVLLLVLAPLLASVAAAIKVCDPGPVVFRQVRVGRGGAGFTMYKFRTMHTGAEQLKQRLRAHNDHRNDVAGGVLFKMRDDPRVTGIGHLLRRLSLDELPQLINVLRGEMSLVGPRPPLPDEVERYADDVHRRLLVKPGLTGLWQVSGRSDLKWEETVRLDLYYVENRSPALDGEILCRTARAVLKGDGAR
jgi:exopolysaccharide biosynthesis polyprenyl glycosylphosphotransferase